MSISPYNTVTLAPPDGMPHVRLREISLRRLPHMEADLRFEEKIYLLSRLDEIGIDESIVWGLDADAQDLILRSRELGLGIEIAFFGKPWDEAERLLIMDRVRACGAPLVCFTGRGPDADLERMGWTRSQMLAACVQTVKEAKDRNLQVNMALNNATQTSISFMQEFSGAVEAAGADRIHLTDSLGVACPEGMRNLVSAVRSTVKIPLEVHCHNDFGLALANSLASVQAGASIVDVAVNGYDPTRSGLLALDEFVMALQLLYGCHTRVVADGLLPLSRMYERMTNTTVATNKPIVGARAFQYRVASGKEKQKSSKHDQWYSSNRVTPFQPALVGNTRPLMFGKYSDTNEIAKWLLDSELTATDHEIEILVSLVVDRGGSQRRALADDELMYLFQIARVAARNDVHPRPMPPRSRTQGGD